MVPQHISCSPRQLRRPRRQQKQKRPAYTSGGLLLVAAVTLFLSSPSVDAAAYAKQCSLLGSKVIEVTYSPATGEYYVTNNDGGEYGQDIFVGGGDRFLRRRRDVETYVYSSEGDLLASLEDGSAVDIREAQESVDRQQQQQQEGEEYYSQQQELVSLHARLCPCAPQENTYCLSQPNEAQNTCGIPRDGRLPVGCYNLTTKMVFIRNAWPVVVLWYGALIIFLIATENGKSARNWVLSKICRGRNETLANQLLRREVVIRDRLRQVRLVGGRRGRDEEEGGEPRVRTQTLVLKTKRFSAQREREKRRRRRRQQRLISNVEEAEINTTADSSFDPDADGVGSGEIYGSTSEETNHMTPERAEPIDSADMDGTPDTVSTFDGSLQSPMSFPPCSSTKPGSDSFYDEGIPQSMSADAAMMCAPCSPITPIQEEDGKDSSSSDDDSEHEEDFTCAICMMAVEDGDKVGALSCHHIFHVTCLKEWIKRRNVCPLCQEPDIASPRPTNTADREGNAAGAPNGETQPTTSANESGDDGTRNSLTVGRRRQGLPPSPDRPPQPRRSTMESIRSRLFAQNEGGRSFISRDSSGSIVLVSSQDSMSTLRLQQSQSEESVGDRSLVLSGSADDAAFQRRRRQHRTSYRRVRSRTTDNI